MIELETLEEMFSNIRANAGWDMDGPMLWGFFFTDASREKLQAALPFLQAEGYRFVDLFMPDLDADEEEYFFLHVEKEEMHTPHSLDLRNQQLEAFAERHALRSYDGMDVGPISDASTRLT